VNGRGVQSRLSVRGAVPIIGRLMMGAFLSLLAVIGVSRAPDENASSIGRSMLQG